MNITYSIIFHIHIPTCDSYTCTPSHAYISFWAYTLTPALFYSLELTKYAGIKLYILQVQISLFMCELVHATFCGNFAVRWIFGGLSSLCHNIFYIFIFVRACKFATFANVAGRAPKCRQCFPSTTIYSCVRAAWVGGFSIGVQCCNLYYTHTYIYIIYICSYS